MIGGAIRAWQAAPVWGVGAGMHQNIWPHVAASGDGDRGKGIWPTLVNDKFHSYEVHSDWIQLLEEYGLVGLILFLILRIKEIRYKPPRWYSKAIARAFLTDR